MRYLPFYVVTWSVLSYIQSEPDFLYVDCGADQAAGPSNFVIT